MIDLHCHILPNLDDGPSEMAQSLAMARMASDDGICEIAATPHMLNTAYDISPQKINEHVDFFNKTLEKNEIELTVYPGAEIYFHPKLSTHIANKTVSSINDTNIYYLIEFPFHFLPDGFKNEIFQLRLNQVIPIIAHPERNVVLQKQPELFYDIINLGCLIQVNTTSIIGGFGEETMACAHQLLKHRLAHIIASDAHSARYRPPVLSIAVDIAAQIMDSKTEALAMVKDLPSRIIAGDHIEISPPPPLSKKFR